MHLKKKIGFMRGIFTGIFLFALITASFGQKSKTDKDYIKSVNKERKEKDKEFIDADNSPLDPKYRKSFNGLDYFKVDPYWRINARIEIYEKPDTIKMKTTTERLPLYIVYGKAYFTVNGNSCELTIYRNVGLMSKPDYEDYLFVPFRDKTSGDKSYGGGRYVDARIMEGDHVIIDFNKAYNPYCVYSKKYSCPVPPSENYLEVEVTAGEKDFAH